MTDEELQLLDRAGKDLKAFVRDFAALRQDAKRWRYVRRVRPGVLLSIAWGESREACAIGDDPDAAIDAAMQQERKA